MPTTIESNALLMSQMMSQPLMISSLLTHAKNNYGVTEIVSRRTEGDIHRYTYADCEQRARQVAQMLSRLGVGPGDRVGTLAWNGYRHLELYYGISGSGSVCHTINPRLFEEQISYIINHAEDNVIFFDVSFLALIEKMVPQCPTVQHWICLSDAEKMPASDHVQLACYETLIAQEKGDYDWPVFDEYAASALCYTSGTTGRPKGALYSHRSTVLHAYASALPGSLSISSAEVIMPVVPMFHVNAWGTPYSCPMTGAKIVFPGAKLDGESLFELIDSEHVTMSAGVPTIWAGLLQYVKENKRTFHACKRTVIGGSTCPPAMMESFREYGVQVVHAWGMTELSPIGTVAGLKAADLNKPRAEQDHILQKQGRSLYGIEMKIVDGNGQPLPNDGKAFGDLMVKGSWVINNYYRAEQSPLVDGWFPTGDVSTIDTDGNMQITDRSKDVIKSGGEWISSIDIENVAVAHPAVLIAACIAVHHPKWDERPLLIIVKKPDVTQDEDTLKNEILAFFEGKVAKWWIPDDVSFIDKMPLTATGKLMKLSLREMFKDHRLEQ